MSLAGTIGGVVCPEVEQAGKGLRFTPMQQSCLCHGSMAHTDEPEQVAARKRKRVRPHAAARLLEQVACESPHPAVKDHTRLQGIITPDMRRMHKRPILAEKTRRLINATNAVASTGAKVNKTRAKCKKREKRILAAERLCTLGECAKLLTARCGCPEGDCFANFQLVMRHMNEQDPNAAAAEVLKLRHSRFCEDKGTEGKNYKVSTVSHISQWCHTTTT